MLSSLRGGGLYIQKYKKNAGEYMPHNSLIVPATAEFVGVGVAAAACMFISHPPCGMSKFVELQNLGAVHLQHCLPGE